VSEPYTKSNFNPVVAELRKLAAMGCQATGHLEMDDSYTVSIVVTPPGFEPGEGDLIVPKGDQ